MLFSTLFGLTTFSIAFNYFVDVTNGHSCQCLYEVQRCTTSVVTPYSNQPSSGGVYKVTARPTPSWPNGLFCMAIPWSILEYGVIGSFIAQDESVKLVFSAEIRGTTGLSHIGVSLNYQDADNYDVLYFRLHGQEFVQGSVVNGQWSSSLDTDLPNGVTLGNDEFFPVWVEVFPATGVCRIYAKERTRLIHEYTTTKPVTGVFGLVTGNGYQDQIVFKNVTANVESIVPELESAKCASGPVTNADGSHTVTAKTTPGWPAGVFCLAIPYDVIDSQGSLSSSTVTYHTQLKGTTGTSHVGMAFNYVDTDNYDVFYFRLHAQMLVVGKVVNGVWSSSYDANLPNGVTLPNNAFFDVWVDITPATGQASIFALSQSNLIHTVTTHFPFSNKFGIATANGYTDSATFKDVSITGNSQIDSERCSAGPVTNADGSHTVTAKATPQWPGGVFCLAIPIDVINNQPVVVPSVTRTYHIQLKGTPGTSHVGMAFNYVGTDNYDVFYFRLHTQMLVVGKVVNGVWSSSYDANLPNGITLPNNAFFDTWVDITPATGQASIFALSQSNLIHTVTTHFPFSNKFGIATANGYTDSATFKDVSVTEGSQSGYEIQRCTSNTVDTVGLAKRVTARTTNPWPTDLFCVAVPWDVINTHSSGQVTLATDANYVYAAQLKGTLSLSHIGFAFNYIDRDNYEFFYLRLHSQDLVIGVIVNGAISFRYDASLPSGVTLPNDAFFNVWLEVSSRGDFASIYLHDRYTMVHSFAPAGPFIPVFGMITANGYSDSVSFKDVSMTRHACMGSIW